MSGRHGVDTMKWVPVRRDGSISGQAGGAVSCIMLARAAACGEAAEVVILRSYAARHGRLLLSIGW